MVALPNGITRLGNSRGYEKTSLYIKGIGSFAEGRPHENTFSVVPKHEKLPNSSGVKFNVETVPTALHADMNKPNLSNDEIVQKTKEEAATFYRDDSDFGDSLAQPNTIRLEVMANGPKSIVFSGGQGFFAACITAFAQHLPLSLSPDHVWSVISYAFAKHVDKNAEVLRKKFVQHEGKKRLEVCADHLAMGGGDLSSGSSASIWEATVFPEFSKQIKKHIGDEIHEAITPDFSTTTCTARAAHEITLMSSMKNYFSYGIRTGCGIPNVTLLGKEEDWVSLRNRAESLGDLMTTEFSNMWMPLLLPVLDEFVESYKGNVNYGFWQSMVKFRNTGGGSGAYSFISGWLQILFPYLKHGNLNTNLRPWQQLYFSGPEPDQIPSIISSAPVDWDYYGTTYNLHFHAGIIGCTQDSSDGSLAPVIGWYVTHAPPQEPDARLQVVKDEIEALIKGHTDEAQRDPLDKESPWYRRVSTLYLEQLSLEGPARKAPLKRELDILLKEHDDYDKILDIKKKLRKMDAEEKNIMLSTEDMIKSFKKN